MGAHGTLGLLVDVTLKLIPQPRAQRTLYAPAPDLATGIAWANQLAAQLMVASAVLVAQDANVAGVPAAPYTLIYTAEGIDEDVAAELKEIQHDAACYRRGSN